MQFSGCAHSPCGAASLSHGSWRAGQVYSLESTMSDAAIRAVGALAEAAQTLISGPLGILTGHVAWGWRGKLLLVKKQCIALWGPVTSQGPWAFLLRLSNDCLYCCAQPFGGLSFRRGFGPFCCVWALVCDHCLRRCFGPCCFSILAGAAGIYETTHGLVRWTSIHVLWLASQCAYNHSALFPCLFCALCHACEQCGPVAYHHGALLTRSSGLAMPRRACSALLLLISKPLRVG